MYLDAVANCSEATFGVHFGKTGESTIVMAGSVRVKSPQPVTGLFLNVTIVAFGSLYWWK